MFTMGTPPPKDRAFFLREWREHAGMTIAALARAISTTHSRVSEVESGAERYNETFLVRCADALDLPAWALIMGPPDEVLPFVELWRECPPDQRAEAAAVARAVVATRKAR